jgi:hypothetical protein
VHRFFNFTVGLLDDNAFLLYLVAFRRGRSDTATCSLSVREKSVIYTARTCTCSFMQESDLFTRSSTGGEIGGAINRQT